MTVLDHTHTRFDPLSGRSVLVAAGRTDRPWQGAEDAPPVDAGVPHDPGCYLCPGNDRAGGVRNPDYDGTWWFPNDFPSLRPDAPQGGAQPHELLAASSRAGTCRVLCYSPRHDLTMSRMSVAQIGSVIDLWSGQLDELSDTWSWVQLFENRGSQMGASNPHPHGQLWATSHLPDVPTVEDQNQRRWHADHGTPLLLDYAQLEHDRRDRVVVEEEEWIVVVPWWAAWPFETLVLPRRHVPRLTPLTQAQRLSLARSLQSLLRRYDGLFGVPFPYSMGWHGAPGASGDDDHWQVHAHFYPPLLRSASVRKWMVGFEMLADVGRDLTAEETADRLRSVQVGQQS